MVLNGSRSLENGQIAVDTAVDGRVASVRVAGELDIRTVDTLDRALDELFGRDLEAICIDGRDLGFVDSAGLRAIVLGLVRASDHGIRYEVSDASEPFDRILAITGLADALGR
jgi:anti-anti-sigma factor